MENLRAAIDTVPGISYNFSKHERSAGGGPEGLPLPLCTGVHMVTVSYDENAEYETQSFPRCRFYDRETDLCRVYSARALQTLQSGLIKCGISYCVKQEQNELLHRFLHGNCFARCIVRVHEDDIETAIEICDGLEDVELLCALPKRDYCPKEVAGGRREQRTRDGEEEKGFGGISLGKA